MTSGLSASDPVADVSEKHFHLDCGHVACCYVPRVDLLALIVLASPFGILAGLATFPWRRSEARRGWAFLLALLIPPLACLATGFVFLAPAGYRDMPQIAEASLHVCVAASVVFGVYLVAFRLKRMRFSASMFALAGFAGTLTAQLVATMWVTANYI